MRLRAGLGLVCVALAGCQHVPDGVDVNLRKGVVTVGPCSCRVPTPAEPKAPTQAEGEPGAADDVPK